MVTKVFATGMEELKIMDQRERHHDNTLKSSCTGAFISHIAEKSLMQQINMQKILLCNFQPDHTRSY